MADKFEHMNIKNAFLGDADDIDMVIINLADQDEMIIDLEGGDSNESN